MGDILVLIIIEAVSLGVGTLVGYFMGYERGIIKGKKQGSKAAAKVWMAGISGDIRYLDDELEVEK